MNSYSTCRLGCRSRSSGAVIYLYNPNYLKDGIISGSGRGLVLTPDEKTIITYENNIKIWDLATEELLSTLSGHSNIVRSVAISNDGSTVVSGSRDGTVKIWDLATGELLSTLQGHSDSVKSVAISPDGSTVVSGSNDTDIRVWRNAIPVR